MIAPSDQGSPDYYRVLGVPPKATVEQVKAAYHRRARRYHPDVNGGDTALQERFKLCSEAYQTLSDPDRRGRYDTQRWASRSPRDMLSGVLSEIMGGSVWSRRHGRDVHAEIRLSLEQSALGACRQLSVLVDAPCRECSGTGAARAGDTVCPDCGGKGERGSGGILALPHPCGRCGGRGRRVATACAACGGVGSVDLERGVEVRVRPGAVDGEQLVLRGRGEPGVQGGRDGDLRATVRVEPHPLLTRAGDDLRLDLPVGIEVAALGGTAQVPMLEDQVRLKIPPGTQSGSLLRVRGRGMPVAGGRGDLLVRVIVETPVRLDAQQRQILANLAEACHGDNQPAQTLFTARVDQLEQDRRAAKDDSGGKP